MALDLGQITITETYDLQIVPRGPFGSQHPLSLGELTIKHRLNGEPSTNIDRLSRAGAAFSSVMNEEEDVD